MIADIEDITKEYCNLCPRSCNVLRDTSSNRGYCKTTRTMKVARYALHMWEEPCISGGNGSGAIFFSGCNLRCIFCQNMPISRGETGQEITESDLEKMIWNLVGQGADNINLVTPSHYSDNIAVVLERVRKDGMSLPVIYNTSSYEKTDAIKRLEGLVDVYLPDMKYLDNQLAFEMSGAKDYVETAKDAIAEMFRQTGKCQFDHESGLIKSGVIVRNLLLPLHTKNTKAVIKYLYENYGDEIFISIMNQYTPPSFELAIPELNRKVTEREYQSVIDYALDLGIKNAFIQEGETAKESFIPQWSDYLLL